VVPGASTRFTNDETGVITGAGTAVKDVETNNSISFDTWDNWDKGGIIPSQIGAVLEALETGMEVTMDSKVAMDAIRLPKSVFKGIGAFNFNSLGTGVSAAVMGMVDTLTSKLNFTYGFITMLRSLFFKLGFFQGGRVLDERVGLFFESGAVEGPSNHLIFEGMILAPF
jgi:hypothetical protein